MSRQFDVHRNSRARGEGDPPLLVNLQSDSFFALPTVIVAPAWPKSRPCPAPELAIAFAIGSGDWILSIAEIAFLRQRVLGPTMGNLSDQRDRIIRAIDRLFTGI